MPIDPSYPDPTPDDAAILLIDHQDKILSWVKSQPADTTVRNVRLLARLGTELGIPLLVTSTDEEQVGLNIKPIQELAPEQFARRVRRGPVFDCFRVDAFQKAVEAFGRRRLILAGLTTDVCAFHTAHSARRLGYDVHVVADACGSPTALAAELTFARLRELGATVTTGNQLLTTLYVSFDSPQGQRARRIGSEELLSGYGQ